MAAPFYNAIKGVTVTAAGTGSYTPSGALGGFMAWSTVPAGWMGLVRYDDGSTWELRYGYWNGTLITRASNIVASSTGSALTLTTAAFATMVIDPAELSPHLAGALTRGWFVNHNMTTQTAIGCNVLNSTVGTVSGAILNSATLLGGQPRNQYTSVTTANGQAGWSSTTTCVLVSTTAGLGGGEFCSRFGVISLPVGPRLVVGVTNAAWPSQIIEPSAFVQQFAMFGKDSTDTNIQFITNDGATGGTKIDTSIVLAANGLYDVTIWWNPGSTTVFGLLMRLDTGAIWYGSTVTDVPGTGSLLMPNCMAGLNGTNTGTAIVFCPMSMTYRMAN